MELIFFCIILKLNGRLRLNHWKAFLPIDSNLKVFSKNELLSALFPCSDIKES